MKVELLYVADCPNHLPTLEIIRDVLREEDLPQDVTQVEITDTSKAGELSFRGSPTVRVDGEDVEPGQNAFAMYGVSCRTYFVDGRFQGIPPREWIRNAVRASSLR